jgi:hypothetical protein
MSQQCVDPIVGKILAGWRYDISGLAAEMRGDYEQHLAACERCRGRQRVHRIIDVGLIALASVSAGVFLLAFVGADLAGRGSGHARARHRDGRGQARRAAGA